MVTWKAIAVTCAVIVLIFCMAGIIRTMEGGDQPTVREVSARGDALVAAETRCVWVGVTGSAVRCSDGDIKTLAGKHYLWILEREE